MFYFDSPGNNQTFDVSGVTLFNSGRAVFVDDGETLNVNDTVFDSNIASSGTAIFIDASQSDITTVMINRSTFSNNQGTSSTSGGAITAKTNSDLTIRDSSFWGNNSTANGGAISASCAFGAFTGACELTVNRSTFSNNSSNRSGGAMSLSGAVSSPLTARIRDSTITDNVADSNQSTNTNYDGGGVHVSSNVSLSLSNTIVAGNRDNSINGSTTREDISVAGNYPPPNSSITTFGSNFVGNNSNVSAVFPAGAPNNNDDYVGTSALALEPNLGPLADNGGPTLSHLPSANAPVIDTGSCEKSSQDQRGFGDIGEQIRAVDDPTVANGPNSDSCDIGAIEVGAESLLVDDESCYVVKSQNDTAVVFCL